MAKIFELLKKKNVSGDFGIEIETEGKRLPQVSAQVWRMENDGSLRGVFPDTRCEYVLPKPVTMKVAKESIKHLIQCGVDQATEWKFSFRTSVHVHLNVLDMEEDALYALIYTYVLLEEVLHNYCGKERKHNRFCLRVQDAEDTIAPMVHLFKNGPYRFAGAWNGDRIRYAAMNLDALTKYGSLEFRGMRGTIDQGVLNNWLSALYNLRAYANKMGSVKAVYLDLMGKGAEAFFEEVLQEYAKVFVFKGYQDAINLAYSLTVELPFTIKEKEQGADKGKELLDYLEGLAAPNPAQRARAVLHQDLENRPIPVQWNVNPAEAPVLRARGVL